MSYPTSAFNPAARSNGQVIDASHVTDLQTEVNAIESALLGTITHSVILGGASLNVTGASTFSSRPVTPPPDAALVYLASTVTIGSSAASTIAWTAQSILTNSSIHSTTSNPSRLTPQSTGVYTFTAQISASSNSTGVRAAVLRDSSAAIIGIQRVPASSVNTFVQVSGMKRFDVTGGYVVVDVQSEGQSTLSLSSGIEATWFAMHKL